MNKKAQGMSMKVIIVAVIALIVLVILVMIFSTKASKFTKETDKTSSQYGSNNCKIPGTGRECSFSKEECESTGGIYDDRGGQGYTDCFGCCSR